jgi:hypothetical protein
MEASSAVLPAWFEGLVQPNGDKDDADDSADLSTRCVFMQRIAVRLLEQRLRTESETKALRALDEHVSGRLATLQRQHDALGTIESQLAQARQVATD